MQLSVKPTESKASDRSAVREWEKLVHTVLGKKIDNTLRIIYIKIVICFPSLH
jgi:hypothetical protein